MNEWMSTYKKLPECDRTVTVLTWDGQVLTAIRRHKGLGDWYEFPDGSRCKFEYVAFWQEPQADIFEEKWQALRDYLEDYKQRINPACQPELSDYERRKRQLIVNILENVMDEMDAIHDKEEEESE